MPKFSANLSMLFNEVAFLDRFEAAAKAGFRGVEYLGPYAFPEGGGRRAAEARTASRRCCSICRRATGARASAASPAIPIASASFARASRQAIDYAHALGCAQVNCLAGIRRRKRRVTEAPSHAGRQSALTPPSELKREGHAARRADQPLRHSRLLPHPQRRALGVIDEIGATISGCNTTSITCSAWRASWRRRWRSICARIAPHPDRRQSRPQRARHRRDQLSLPVPHGSTRSAIPAGSAANTSRRARPRTGSAGSLALTARRPATDEDANDMEIGFIGLGVMGAPMAGHLIKAGHKLHLYIAPRPPPELAEAGASLRRSGKEVAEHADIVIIMVPDTPDVETVLFGEDGVAAGPDAGQDRRRHEFDLADRDQAIRQAHRRLGCDYLDAPVSGGEVGAKAATLSIMCGGRRPHSRASSRCSN